MNPPPAPAPAPAPVPGPAVPPPRRRWLAAVPGQLLGLLFSLLMALALAWFLRTNPALLPLFRHLAGPWQWGGAPFEWAALGAAAAAVLLFTIVGLLYLEGHEQYLPRAPKLCLGFLFGMGLCGVVLEWLAIPWLLYRPLIALALGVLLIGLTLRAWRRAHQPPDGGHGGDAGPAEAQLRLTLARDAFAMSLTLPRTLAARLFRAAAVLLIAAISLAIFWHALLYPEVYWDSLILYLGYARMTLLEHGFPVKVVGQVGIGLGANYPHLFSVLGSGITVCLGTWSELPQRHIAPLCGLASTVLIYHTALRLARHVNFALAIALLYRALPLTVAWDQYASDYALVLLFGTGFLYLALLYLQTRLRGYLWSATLLIALALHLNYLMGILAVPWAVLLLATHWPGAAPAAAAPAPEDPLARERRFAPWVALRRDPGLRALLAAPAFWAMLAASAAIGSTWFIRNWLITGNPVYAFFYEHLGGRNINPEVMQAAAVEWQANGWGIGLLGTTLPERLRGAWHYFITATPATGGGQAYLTQPLLLGFAAAGVLTWLGLALASPWAARRRACQAAALARFGWVVLALTLALVAFHFILAPFYLYQIIKLAPCLALLAALAWPVWRQRPWGAFLGAGALLAGLVPGLAMALMGFKIVGSFELPGGRRESPLSLYPLRNPLPRPEIYYRMRYGDDARMWEWVNANLRGARLLTHENRHLVFDPSIALVHLDDWDMQALWNEPDPARRVRRLVHESNIRHYLFVPNELAAPSNARMGTAAWERLGLMRLLHTAGESRLYELTPDPRPAAAATTTTTTTLTAQPAPPAPVTRGPLPATTGTLSISSSTTSTAP